MIFHQIWERSCEGSTWIECCPLSISRRKAKFLCPIVLFSVRVERGVRGKLIMEKTTRSKELALEGLATTKTEKTVRRSFGSRKINLSFWKKALKSTILSILQKQKLPSAKQLSLRPRQMVFGFRTDSKVPTPIHKWNLPDLPPNTEVYIKREDLCGLQLTGNKARKLEFVLAEAVSLGADCVITMGGRQSNHCRATAVAAKYLNLDCFLILCTDEALAEEDPGLSGNLLIERLVGAHIEQASWEEFFKYGSKGLLNSLKTQLEKNGRTPYIVPIGASNALGTWGYIDAVREIEQQLQQPEFREINFDAIVAPCGSCGTVVGLSLGSTLSTLKAEVHAFSVGEDLDNCYEYAQGLLDELQAGLKSRDLLHMQSAKGLGYALSTTEELEFIKEVAKTTGVILDPVYSGKAAYAFMNDMKENPKKWEDKKVLFIHTGGIFALYDKATKQMSTMIGRCKRMVIDDSVPPKDASQLW